MAIGLLGDKVFAWNRLYLYSKACEWCTITGKTWEWEPHRLACGSSQAGATVIRTNNEETRKEFDSAIEKCMNFEREHNIENRATILTAVAKIIRFL